MNSPQRRYWDIKTVKKPKRPLEALTLERIEHIIPGYSAFVNRGNQIIKKEQAWQNKMV